MQNVRGLRKYAVMLMVLGLIQVFFLSETIRPMIYRLEYGGIWYGGAQYWFWINFRQVVSAVWLFVLSVVLMKKYTKIHTAVNMVINYYLISGILTTIISLYWFEVEYLILYGIVFPVIFILYRVRFGEFKKGNKKSMNILTIVGIAVNVLSILIFLVIELQYDGFEFDTFVRLIRLGPANCILMSIVMFKLIKEYNVQYLPRNVVKNTSVNYGNTGYSPVAYRGSFQPFQGSGDYYEQLEKLAALKEKGIITTEEFEIKKKQILERI